MSDLKPIPSPPAQLLREFCARFVPILVFAAGCAGVVALWRVQGMGRSLTGVGEGLRASVLSPQPGLIVRHLVEPHSQVRRGDPIAVIQPFDPRAGLEVLRTRLDIARLEATPTLQERNAIDVERLRLELLRTRSELAIARVRLSFAERELARQEPLYRDQLVTADAYELSLGTRDMHAAEVGELSKTVAELEGRLATLDAGPVALLGAPTGDLADLHATATNRLAETVLVAPIDGTVGLFLRQPGEFVVEGELVNAVQADRAERIVGYLRQPFGFEPRPGLPVTVRLRAGLRRSFASEIRHVGPQFETVTNALALVREGMLVDAALPVFIDVPPEVHIRPGEVVDLLARAPQTSLSTAAAATATPLPEVRSPR